MKCGRGRELAVWGTWGLAPTLNPSLGVTVNNHGRSATAAIDDSDVRDVRIL